MNRRERNPYRWQNPNFEGRPKFQQQNKRYNRPRPFRGMPPRMPHTQGSERYQKQHEEFSPEHRPSREIRERGDYFDRDVEPKSRYHDEEPRYPESSFSNNRYERRNRDSFQGHEDRDVVRNDQHHSYDDFSHTSNRSDFFGGKFPSSGRPQRDDYFDYRADYSGGQSNEFNKRYGADEPNVRDFHDYNSYRNDRERAPNQSRDFNNDGNRYQRDGDIHYDYYKRELDPISRERNYSGKNSTFDDRTLDRYEEELQRRENEDRDRMKDVLLQHLKPDDNENDKVKLNMEEIDRIINNPTLKQLLQKVNGINQSEQTNANVNTIEKTNTTAVSNYRSDFDDDEKFLYGSNESTKPIPNEFRSSVKEKHHHKARSSKEHSHEPRSKKKRRSYERSRSRSRSSSKRTRRSSQDHSSHKSTDYSRGRSPGRRNSNRRSKDIEDFLLNAADVAVKNPNMPIPLPEKPIFFNYSQVATSFAVPRSNMNIVNMRSPMVPLQGPPPHAVDLTREKRVNNAYQTHPHMSPFRIPFSNQTVLHKELTNKTSIPSNKVFSSSSSKSFSQKPISTHSVSTLRSSSVSASKTYTLTDMISDAKKSSRKSSSRDKRSPKKIDRGLKIIVDLPTDKKQPEKQCEQYTDKRKLKYKPWYNDQCRRIERRRRNQLRILTKAKSYTKNAKQVDLIRERLRQVTRLYTHTLRDAKAAYFKEVEGDTEEFCGLMLRDIVDKICTYERRGVSEEIRINALNRKYNLNIPLPYSSDNKKNSVALPAENERVLEDGRESEINEKCSQENPIKKDSFDCKIEHKKTDDVFEKDDIAAESDCNDNETAESEGSENKNSESENSDNENPESENSDNENAESEGSDNEGSENENIKSDGSDNENTESEKSDNESAESENSDDENAESEKSDNEDAESDVSDNEGNDPDNCTNANSTNNDGENKENSDNEVNQPGSVTLRNKPVTKEGENSESEDGSRDDKSENEDENEDVDDSESNSSSGSVISINSNIKVIDLVEIESDDEKTEHNHIVDTTSNKNRASTDNIQKVESDSEITDGSVSNSESSNTERREKISKLYNAALGESSPENSSYEKSVESSSGNINPSINDTKYSEASYIVLSEDEPNNLSSNENEKSPQHEDARINFKDNIFNIKRFDNNDKMLGNISSKEETPVVIEID